MERENTCRKFSPPLQAPAERLQAVDTLLRGMELALSSVPSFPVKIVDGEELRDLLLEQRRTLLQNLDRRRAAAKETTAPVLLVARPPSSSEDLPPLFFLFCMKLLGDLHPTPEHLSDNRVAPARSASAGSPTAQQGEPPAGTTARAQGTALGTVYGVLGALVSRDLMWLRILVLLPWIVLTSFLRRSRMYGHAGGICAALAAIMVLGRRYGAASDAFAVTRLTETCIGLSCSILVELLLQPTRASSLARMQLSQSITELRDRVNSAPELSLPTTERAIRVRIDQLEKTIGEADGEPNFWFLPFPAAHYRNLQSSLRKMVELVVFIGRGLELLKRVLPELDWNEVQELIREDMDAFKKVVGSSLQHCLDQDVGRSDKKVVGALDQTMSCSEDLEMGKAPPPPKLCPYCTVVRDDHEEDPEKILASFLRHAEDVAERSVRPGGVEGDHGDGDLGGACRRSQVVLCMAAVGFCMGGLMREAQEVRKAVVELAQRENPPTRQVGHHLFEISSKLRKKLNI